MNNFERYTAILERTLAGWRNVIKVDGVDGSLFGFKDLGDTWEYTFSLRINGVWHPAKKSFDPVDVDSPIWDTSSETPINMATRQALELMQTINEDLDETIQ